MIFPARGFAAAYAQVLDPRGREGKCHPLSASLMAVVCAVLCGANGDKPSCQWLQKSPVVFWDFLGFTRRPSRYGVLRNLLLVLDPQSCEDVLRGWLHSTCVPAAPAEPLSAVAVDGNTQWGTGGVDQRALMLVAAFEHETGGVLRQQSVPADSNEQKAALDLLRQLILTGRVITADALHCPQETCRFITDSGGHYVIPVKDNQPALLACNRGHWGIENRLHDVHDTTFGEDQSRIRSGHGSQHLATARSAAIAFC